MIGRISAWQVATQRYSRLPSVRVALLLALALILLLVSLSAVSTGAVNIKRDVVFKVSVDAIADKRYVIYCLSSIDMLRNDIDAVSVDARPVRRGALLATPSAGRRGLGIIQVATGDVAARWYRQSSVSRT